MKFKLSKSDIIVAICFLLYIILEIYLEAFFDIDMLNASDSELFRFSIFKNISFVLLIIAVSISIISGIRLLRRDGFNIKRFLSPAFWVLFCILLAGMSMYLNITTIEIQKTLFNNTSFQEEKIKEFLNNDKKLTLSQRSEISLMYAKDVWHKTGRSIKYITNDGDETMYKPAAEEIEDRRKSIRANEILSWSVAGMQQAAVIWFSIAFISILLGFFTPLRRKDSQIKEQIN